MPKCGIELGLRDVDLESDLHDRMNDGLDGYTLSRPKKGCCSNIGEHDLEQRGRRSRGGWLSLWSRLVVGFEGAGKSVAGLGRAGSSRSAGALSGSSLGAATVGGRVSGAVCVINPGKTE